eukprot:m.256556 g.256556  ORF g.256556 m.256556 type:complete len:179 (-) comp17571_c0_seq1:90-626(-)
MPFLKLSRCHRQSQKQHQLSPAIFDPVLTPAGQHSSKRDSFQLVAMPENSPQDRLLLMSNSRDQSNQLQTHLDVDQSLSAVSSPSNSPISSRCSSQRCLAKEPTEVKMIGFYNTQATANDGSRDSVPLNLSAADLAQCERLQQSALNDSLAKVVMKVEERSAPDNGRSWFTQLVHIEV